jgi:hypothetical protein
MTVAVTHRYTLSVVGGVKQLRRRRLPTRLRRNRPEEATNAFSCNDSLHIPSPLKTLRHSYARRGIATAQHPELTPPPSDENRTAHEVSQVSLAGAKRRYVELDVPSSDDDYCSDSSESFLSSSSSSTTRDCRRYADKVSRRRHVKYVQFASHSVVVEIPHFRDYSSSQKAAMWNGSRTIKRMARKNTMEFQYDGWKMDEAAEEDQFVLVSGEAVHPVHAALRAVPNAESDELSS